MTIEISRRSLLASGGTLAVFVALPGASALAATLPFGSPTKPALTPEQLASYVAIHADGSATTYFGKMDMGQGTDIGIAQMVAEELDLAVERVAVVMDDTDLTVDQGGASGSTGIQKGGVTLRSAAAEARRALVAMAAAHLGMPVEDLDVENGVVASRSAPQKKVSYGELIGGRYFNVVLDWNGKYGNDLFVSGKAKPKTPDRYKVIGTSVPRRDVAPKVLGTAEYVVDVKLPGMLHARTIKPPKAGAEPTAVDTASIAAIPGAKIVWQKAFLAVVAPKEWDAIRAAAALKVTWTDPPPAFPGNASLYDHIRQAKPIAKKTEAEIGNVDATFAGAARIIEATYEWPFQSHASMAPACAVADVRADGVTLWTGSQKAHHAQAGVAALLGVPREKVHAIWIFGPGSYGRNDAGDAAMDAALISKAMGAPVRVQGMRHEGHAWDPKGPASIHTVRAALDKDDKVLALDFVSKGFSRLDVDNNESDPAQTLAGQFIGLPLHPVQAFNVPEESYGFAARRKGWETIAPFLDRGSPLRSSHLRDPVGPQIHYASESFIDELAHETGSDAAAFRLRYLTDARDHAVIKAATERSNWQPRVSPAKPTGAEIMSGRGIAYSQRNGTRVAIVSEVEVNRTTGAVWAKRFTVAHDCGQIINPGLLRRTIEGNIVQGVSRALHEEVLFDTANVTSVDWLSYPILDIKEAPEAIDIVLIDHPEIAPSGAGEPSIRPLMAAIANAIFDATGVRMRQAPFTPERLKAGFA